MCMQFTIDKNQVRFCCSPPPCRKATNSAGPGARQGATDSAQLVYQIRTLDEF